VTVYAVLLVLPKFESVPPDALMSLSAKVDDASLRVIETLTLDPAATLDDATVAVGGI
jgi:hypothetical protein